MKFKRAAFAILLVGALALVGYLAGCGAKGGTGTESDGFIELTSNLDSNCVQPLERTSAKITATVVQGNGNPVPVGTLVVFRLTPAIATFPNGQQVFSTHTTDATGVVVVTVIFGNQQGDLAVTAESIGKKSRLDIFLFFDSSKCPGADTGTGSGSGTDTSTSTDTSGGSGSGSAALSTSILLSAPSLAMSTNDAQTVTATVHDADGNPVPMGTNVTFFTDLGTFSNGRQDITVATADENGTASTALFAGSTPGLATVYASSGGDNQVINVEILAR